MDQVTQKAVPRSCYPRPAANDIGMWFHFSPTKQGHLRHICPLQPFLVDMLKEIWITRHGYREDWVTPTPHLPTQLSHDPPLSELGLAQAEELGEFLQDKGIQRVYSSPFYRVLQTVSPLIAKTHIPLYIDFSMR